jgi:hypothetical protein
MSRMTWFTSALAVAALMAPSLAAAQSDPSRPRARTVAVTAPPPGVVAGDPTTEQKRSNTYQTYKPGSAGCIDDLGYGRIKVGCSD